MLDRLQTDLKDAMRANDELRKTTIRSLIAALKNAAIDKRQGLSDEDVLEILSREAKRRREAAEGFRTGDREDSAQREEAELALIEGYLPQQLSEDEVRQIAREIIAEVKPAGPREMGKVMGQVMPRLKGRFDGKAASALVKDEFTKAVGG